MCIDRERARDRNETLIQQILCACHQMRRVFLKEERVTIDRDKKKIREKAARIAGNEFNLKMGQR